MKRIAICALALILTLGLDASTARAAETTVKFGWCALTITSAAAPFAIATKMGWFAEAGLKVELVPLPGSTDCVKLTATGDVAYSLPSVEPLIPIRLQGVKAHIVYEAYQGNIYGLAVTADSPVKNIKDLKGKKIGVASMASGAVPVVRALLKMNGMDPEKDAQIVVVGEAAQAAALARNKQADALALYDTQFALIENAGVALRMLDTGPLAKFPSNGFLVLDDYLQKNRAQAIALGRAYAMGTIFAINNPEAAVKIVYEIYPQTKPTGKSEADALRDDVKVLEARAQHWRLEAGGVRRWGESNMREFDAYEDYLLKEGVIKQKLPVTDLVSNDLIGEVNKFDARKIAAMAKAYK